MADTAPLRDLISRYIDEDMMAAIAAEGRRGRQLYAGTVNLDAGRPVIWNLTSIAAVGDQASLDLIHEVLLASASIPGVFPPVMIEVEADGELYEEMHVDGGAAQQVFLYPLGVDWAANARKLRVIGYPDVWTIRNARLEPSYVAVKQRAIPIAARALGSVMRYQGLGDMYRIYAGAKRDGMNYHLAYIPAEFDEEPQEEFDSEYMRALFDLARDMARSGYPWKSEPPASIVEVHEID